MRRLGAVLALGLAAWFAAACGGEPNASPPRPQTQVSTPQPQEQPQQQTSTPEQAAAPPVVTFELNAADIGPHLEDTTLFPGLPLDLAEMSDPVLSALPDRARRSEGRLMQPSPQAETGETFWMHVFSDVSAESAVAWVSHLASLPAGTALAFTSPQHQLFGSEFRPLSGLGDAVVSVELLHGHEGGRWLTQLVVFAQNGAIVFVKSSRREEFDALTDVDAVASLISERLRAAPVQSAE